MSCGGNTDGSANANAAAVKAAAAGLPVTAVQARREFHALTSQARERLATAHHVPLTRERVETLYTELCEEFPTGHFGLAHCQYPNSDVTWMEISVIRFDEADRGRGAGTAVMNRVTEVADANGWMLTLTPDGQWGSSVPRLRRFYARHGFVANSGRNRDYRISNTMLRHPTPPLSPAELTEAAHATARQQLRRHLEGLTSGTPDPSTGSTGRN